MKVLSMVVKLNSVSQDNKMHKDFCPKSNCGLKGVAILPQLVPCAFNLVGRRALAVPFYYLIF